MGGRSSKAQIEQVTKVEDALENSQPFDTINMATPASEPQTLLVPPPDPSIPTEPLSPRSRRSSFSFLRRSKSRDVIETKDTSVTKKLSRRRRKSLSKDERDKKVEVVPQLPIYTSLPKISAPGISNGANASSDSIAVAPSRSAYNPNTFYQRYRPMDPSEFSASGGGQADGSAMPDPFARTESMTNRGRYSYASSAVSGVVNSPRRVRRRKDPTPFNILVVGTENCGKTSFIEFLRNALARPARFRPSSPSPPSTAMPQVAKDSTFVPQYVETELEGERIGLTLWDSKSLDKSIVDFQLREITGFIESKFQETFYEEQKVLRATGIRDTHIHAVFLILDPRRLDKNISISKSNSTSQATDQFGKQSVVGGLDSRLDVDLLKSLQGKTTVIPIISKADTITTAHMAYLKRTVWGGLKKLKIDPLEALNLESDNESEYDTASSNAADDDDDQNENIFDDSKDSKPFNENTNGDAAKGATLEPASSSAPTHDDIRFSTMSDNVDLPLFPLSIISPDMLYDPGTIGRRFPWGFADPYNSEHCDFVRLKDNVFSDWRAELREAARLKFFEGWRTSRLKTRNFAGPLKSITPHFPGRAVSGAAAYVGNGPEARPSTGHASVRAASAADIGVAVTSSNGPIISMPQRSSRGLGSD